MVQKLLFLCLWCIVGLLASCTSTEPDQQSTPVVEKQFSTQLAEPEPAASSQLTKPLSPYSTDGMIALNQYRTYNQSLNDFLIRNRKPDYFFSSGNTEFSFQKIYLVYLESDNLYLFDSTFNEKYKKFHPLPGSVKESMKNAIPVKEIVRAPVSPDRNATYYNPQRGKNSPILDIEKNLLESPSPMLSKEFLKSIPVKNPPSYPDIYFFDRSITDLVENDYSIKYEKSKGLLKIIFPQSYRADLLYHSKNIETKKIIFFASKTTGEEISLIVPDFLPGSPYYESAHGNMKKDFLSLYQLKIPNNFSKKENLRMRIQLKICQNDYFDYCKAVENNKEEIRAIVISSTIYDKTSLIPLETFIIK